MTIGIVLVACLAAIAADVPQGHDNVDRNCDELRRKRRVAVVPSLRETRFKSEILPLDISVLPQFMGKSL